jgi:NAD(P)H-hydrate epimerase
MIRVLSVEQVRQVEEAANAAGTPYDEMMQNAGTAVARRVLDVLRELPDPNEARVTLLIGPGKNGGDGLVAGRVIAENSHALVRFYLLTRRDESDPHFKAVSDAGLFIAYAEDDQRFRVLTNQIASAHVLVDALFGIGVKLPLRDSAAKLLRAANKALIEMETDASQPQRLTAPTPQRGARPYIIAVDCPSGLDCDSGELDKNALTADETVTFIAAKPGLFSFPGASAVGALTLASAGVPASTERLKDAPYTIADPAVVRELLPVRPAQSNKGTFGKVLILGGSVNYTGAPALSARAAYRAGAGLVTVGAPAPTVAALAGSLHEVTWLLFPHDMGVLSVNAAPMIREEAKNYNVMLIGPGWGREKTTGELLTRLLSGDAAAGSPRRAMGFGGTQAASSPAEETVKLPALVIDADGLNLLAETDEWWKLLPENTVLTPHPGEMARLAKTTTDDVQARRWQIAEEKAREWGVILVLKGAHTLIAAPDGRVTVLPFKTSALAKAGTGDVLAGATAGMIAQGLAAYEAAVVAGYLHGLAGEQAAQKLGSERSVVAGDVVETLADAFRLLS